MPVLRVADIVAAFPVQPRHLDPDKVARYAEISGSLPPVVVFDTEDGLLLVDGYHRVDAARRRGAETIEAEVRRGSRHDALEYVAEVNGLELDEVIRRVREFAPRNASRSIPPLPTQAARTRPHFTVGLPLSATETELKLGITRKSAPGAHFQERFFSRWL